ncbi:Uncharacterised protein [Mycobacteroides abscessus subsp. massiliense]|nr:Uncharacterised protein [Mycobacteroides abscessus subsp. massiliense]
MHSLKAPIGRRHGGLIDVARRDGELDSQIPQIGGKADKFLTSQIVGHRDGDDLRRCALRRLNHIPIITDDGNTTVANLDFRCTVTRIGRGSACTHHLESTVPMTIERGHHLPDGIVITGQ